MIIEKTLNSEESQIPNPSLQKNLNELAHLKKSSENSGGVEFTPKKTDQPFRNTIDNPTAKKDLRTYLVANNQNEFRAGDITLDHTPIPTQPRDLQIPNNETGNL